MASVEDVIKYIIQLFCPDTGWLPLLRVDVILDKLNFELFRISYETNEKLAAIFQAEKTNKNSPEFASPTARSSLNNHVIYPTTVGH